MARFTKSQASACRNKAWAAAGSPTAFYKEYGKCLAPIMSKKGKKAKKARKARKGKRR